MRFAFLIPPMMLLAACGQGEEKKDKTEVSINAGDEHGGVQITAGKDGNGRIKIGGDGVGIETVIDCLFPSLENVAQRHLFRVF